MRTRIETLPPTTANSAVQATAQIYGTLVTFEAILGAVS